MSTVIYMPDIGSDHAVEVIDVLVAVGDAIAAEDGLVTIETDKATMDVPCPEAGSVAAILAKVGDKLQKGDPLIELEAASAKDDAEEPEPETAEPDAKESSAEEAQTEKPDTEEPAAEGTTVEVESAAEEPKAAETTATKKPNAAPPADANTSGEHIYSSPAVRYIAREWGVDLHKVSGTGRNGRILKHDMQAYVRQQLAKGDGGGALPSVPFVDYSRFGEIEQRPLSKIQHLSASNLHASWVNIPHVTQHYRADISNVEQARKGHNQLSDTKLTPLAYLIKSVSDILQEMDRFNSSLSEDGRSINVRKFINIGFAVDTDNGLLVPVIKDVDQLSIQQIASKTAELAAKARDGKLSPAEMQGGGFTISSLGHIGSDNNGPDYFTPIVLPPQVAILGVSRSKTEAAWDGNAFVPRLMLPLSLSYDHRVIDGVAAGQFMHKLGQRLASF